MRFCHGILIILFKAPQGFSIEVLRTFGRGGPPAGGSEDPELLSCWNFKKWMSAFCHTVYLFVMLNSFQHLMLLIINKLSKRPWNKFRVTFALWCITDIQTSKRTLHQIPLNPLWYSTIVFRIMICNQRGTGNAASEHVPGTKKAPGQDAFQF